MHKLIDISSHQGTDVNFDAVEECGVKGVYIKATEGTSYANPLRIAQQYRARSHNLRTGFYHFLRCRGDRSGAAEADYFWSKVRTIKAGDGDRAQLMRLVADVEATTVPADDTRRYVRQFVDRIKQLSGHEPVLYTYPSFLANWGDELGGLRLWIADYGDGAPRLPAPFADWVMHQYTSDGVIPGILGRCDVNRCPDLGELMLDRSQY